jgi:ABC-2 type transport system ATP-binding protein
VELKFVNIKKSFSGKEVLHGLNFRVESGRAMGFLGRNGAGKSTTFRCLMQVFRQDSGEFILDGRPFDVTKHRIGYLPEERGMYAKVTLRDQLSYFARLKGASKKAAAEDADHWLRYFELEDSADQKLETLSKGNQQKVQISQAFLNDPDIIILDEPFSGLDPVNAQIFKQAIREMVSRDKLVIFSSHQMAYVEEMCDDITLIDRGNILLTGNLEEIRAEKGANRYFIEPVPGSENQIRAALDAAGISYSEKNGRMITDRQEPGIRQVIGSCFSSVLTCGIYRPSLQDIFIEEAGEAENA